MSARTTELRSTWLVQRLEKPDMWAKRGVDNPFSFGGGLRNGGLSDDAMGLLRGIFSFDYMGAAEFEFGAVPQALTRIAQGAPDLHAFTIAVPLAEVPKSWRDKSKAKPTGNATVYALAPKQWQQQVAERVNEWSRTEFVDMKEQLRLTSALRPVEDWDSRVAGWLELDNGFFFFTDRDMWAQTCALFGVEVAL